MAAMVLPQANITVISMYRQSGGENARFRTEVSILTRSPRSKSHFNFDLKIFWDTTSLTDLRAGFPLDGVRICCWLHYYQKCIKGYIFPSTLSFSLRFFSFVLERGKNPENPGCFLGVKIFWNVGNFRKTGICEVLDSDISKSKTISHFCLVLTLHLPGCSGPERLKDHQWHGPTCGRTETDPVLSQGCWETVWYAVHWHQRQPQLSLRPYE